MQHKYTAASDVWSFGVVMWEVSDQSKIISDHLHFLFQVMSFGERPYWDWTNHRVIQEVVHNCYRLPAPQDTPQRIYEIMLACWHTERSKIKDFWPFIHFIFLRHQRPSFADLLEQLNAFLNNVDFFYKYI